MSGKIRLLLASLALLGGLTTSQASEVEMMSTEEIKQGYQRHAALTQLYRWYLLYENPAYGIDNALDSLDDDVYIKSGLGEARGHADYAARVAKLPTDWQNAHEVHSPSVTINEDGTLSLTTDITYSNVGMLDDGAVRAAELQYTMTLAPSDTVLPKFTSIEIAPKSDGVAETFESAYPYNRARSLVHYWLALIEDPARNPEPAKEILAERFSLNFSSGAITDFDGLKAWLAGTASQVVASAHKISNFAVTSEASNQYTVTMDFDWNGILPNDAEMIAKTRHTWVISDDPTERFARIQSVDVDILEPFAPKP